MSHDKYCSLMTYILAIDKCNQSDCLWRPYLLLLVYNTVPVLIGSTLVAYIEVGIFIINFSICMIAINLAQFF